VGKGIPRGCILSDDGLGHPLLDSSYAERVAYQCGMKMEVSDCSRKRNGPHNSELCEGCRWALQGLGVDGSSAFIFHCS
jgi:hypothetical protein